MAGTLTTSQPSFAGGELAPSLRARADLAKYRVALELCRDFLVMPGGGVASRPGTKAILRSKQSAISAVKPRLVPFSYSTTQNYVLEFGHLYLRVLYNGGYALETTQSITTVTRGATTVIGKNAHGYSNGDWIYFFSVIGCTQLNSSPGFCGVVTGATANNFTITDIDGNAVDSSAWPAFVAGSMARVYTVTSPYDEDDLPLIKFAQNADTMTITHPSYSGRYLTRTAHTSWTFTTISFAPLVQKPTGVTLTRSVVGNFVKAYQVTAVVDSTGEESEPTATVDTTAAPTDALNQDTGRNIKVSWTAPASGPTPDRYNVYSAPQAINTIGTVTPTVFGYIGSSTGTYFVDTNIAPDFSLGPPRVVDITAGYGNFGVNTYFQGRQWFAATTNYPQVLAASMAGNYKMFYEHHPVRADDPFVIQLLSSQVNAIKHLVSLNNLIALTGGGAWLVSGDSAEDAVTALSVRGRPQQYNGCSDVPPLNVSSDVLYAQDRGAKIRTLAYDFNTDLFTGVDITVLASHFFTGYTINEMAYCEEPYSLVHVIRSDGAMPVMTYLKEQDIYAWTLWETPGDSGADGYISVASIPEGEEHVAYVVVKRTMPGVKSGNWFYMIERFASRQWLDGDDVDPDLVWALDSAVEFNSPATTTLTGLHHLIGATVVVYSDGGLLGEEVVSAAGEVVIDRLGSRVFVGLPYTPTVRTLRLDLGEPSVQGKKKKVAGVAVAMGNARGLQMASMRMNIDGTHSPGAYVEIRERSSVQTMSSPLPFITGVRTATIVGGYQIDGAVQIACTPGIPAEIYAITPTVVVGSDNG